MTKANITQYSATANSNTDIDDINIDENCPASGLNNALRSLMAHLKNVDTGSQALTALSVTGVGTFGSLDISGNIDVDGTTNLDVVDIDGAVDMATTLAVTGALSAKGGAVFNEGGADVDFRVESDTLTHALFVNGADGKIGIGESSPNAGLQITSTNNDINKIRLAYANTTHYMEIGRLAGSYRIASFENGQALTFGTTTSAGATTERLKIDSAGRMLLGTTTSNVASANQFGVVLNDNSAGSAYLGTVQASANGNGSLFLNRGSDDGVLAIFKQAGTDEGSISVSGNTVSYNAFSGSHWSRLTDNSKPTILKGTVIETIDEMCDWYNAQFTVLATEDAEEYVMNDPIELPDGKSVGDTITHTYDGTDYSAKIIKEDDNKHTKCKISDTADSKRVYGVFADFDNDDDTVNDMYVTAVGTHIVRINKDVTVSAGDLLSSNGDGTAKVQDDDIIRSKTIGKVLTNIKQETYSDGSYTVPCALYCG